MLMSLSLRITRKLGVSRNPAWFSPSKASPAVMEPSPITATQAKVCFSRSRAVAMPRAAEMEVLACPAPKWS